MSWKLTGLVSQKRVGSQSRKLLLLSMADKANDDGSGVFASFQTLADMCESSRATVKRLIKQFEDEKLIKHVGMRTCKNGQTNEYDISLEVLNELPDIGEKTGVTVNPVQSKPGSPRSRTRVTMTPKPILEPIQLHLSEEPQVPDAKQRSKSKAGIVTLELEMSDRMRKFAGERGYLNGSGEALFERFRAHHAAKGSIYVSFDAAFQTWVLNELKFNQHRPQRGATEPAHGQRPHNRQAPRNAAERDAAASAASIASWRRVLGEDDPQHDADDARESRQPSIGH